jgi:hypothetical protein
MPSTNLQWDNLSHLVLDWSLVANAQNLLIDYLKIRAFEYLDTLDPGPDTLDTGNPFKPKSSNNPSHLVTSAVAVPVLPHLAERFQTLQ